MPSPTAATSRRTAWLTLMTASVATFSGSDRRIAISETERATKRSSCVRQTVEANAQMKPIGTNRKSATFRKRGLVKTSPPSPKMPPVDVA